MDAAAHPPATWYLLSLRPRGGHAALRGAVRAAGGDLLALSPWRIARLDDADSRAALERALAAPATLFTSPAAVDAAQALQPDFARRLACAVAVGEGSARALRRHGVDQVLSPERMDSEGVLALPQLQGLSGIGLVTAPGGRGVLTSALPARGTAVIRADVYRRLALPLAPRTLARLRRLLPGSALALSSGEAFTTVLGQLPAPLATALRRRPVLAASDRLAALAGDAGFTWVIRADGPLPAQLAAAAALTLRPPR